MSDEAEGGTLVVGLGNPIMGDDGIGLALLERLRGRWEGSAGVRFADGGTWGMMLLPLIEDADRLLLLDAIAVARPPGTPVVIERVDLPRYFGLKLSPHQIDLREVLALAELRGTLPPDVVAIGVRPEVVKMSTELSDAVAAGLDAAVSLAAERLTAWGHEAPVSEEPSAA
jgi:hydrogenase maturation protease